MGTKTIIKHVEYELVIKHVQCIYELDGFEYNQYYKAEKINGVWTINGREFDTKLFNRHFF